MIRLIAVDMDGTLLDSSHRLPPGLFPVVRELKRRGVRFAVSSGRQYYNLLKLFEPVRDEVTFICENGAIVFENHRNVYCSEIGFDRLVEPLRAIRAIRGAEPVFCGLKSAYAESRDPFFLENACRYSERLEIVPDILEAAKQDKICKVAVFDAVDAESNCYVRLERFRDGFMVILSGSRWVDLMNPGVDKGVAIEALQRQFGIAPAECMAFGDYLNDCGMMRVCDYSYAMANAHPGLKAVCRFEAKSNDENGVLEKIREFFPEL